MLGLASAEGPLSGDDHYSLWTAAAALSGDRPNVDFFDPGSPLQWWLSYLGQLVSGGRTIAEIAIALTLKTFGIVAVFLVSLRLLGRRSYAWISTTLVVSLLLAYQIYGADKLLLYPTAVLLAWAYLAGSTAPWALGIFLAAAFLLRHDHGLYIGLLFAGVILVGPRPRWRSMVISGACAFVLCTPWLWWLARTEGILQYFSTRITFARELGLTESRPLFRVVTPLWTAENASYFLWHVALVLPVLGLAVGLRRRHREAVALSAILLLIELGIMRQGMQVKETGILWVPLFAWLLLEIRRGTGAWVLRGTAAAALVAVVAITDAPNRLWALTVDEDGAFARASRAVAFHSLPRRLDDYAPQTVRNERLLVRYVEQCLAPGDRIWDTSVWFPLTYHSNRRPVWHPYWERGFLSDEPSQHAFLRWVANVSAPVIVIRKRRGDYWSAFESYPLVRDYVARHYQRVMSAALDRFVADGNVVQILIDGRRRPTGRFEPLDLPCFAGGGPAQS